MARETQKEKILRLEKENSEMRDKYLEMKTIADEDFMKSPACKQMQEQIDSWIDIVETLKRNLNNADEKNKKLIVMVEKLRLELENKKDTSRNAGRKPKFSGVQIEEIKRMHESGMSIAKIASEKECSVGLVHKLLHS